VYSHFGYQYVIPLFLRKADRIIAVSQSTLRQCEFRGIASKKLLVIPNGINYDQVETCSEFDKEEILSKYNIDIDGKKILLTVGRLIKRKGHAWFIANVMKDLPGNYVYLIVGHGPEYEAIHDLIDKLGLKDRVYMLGRVSEGEKNCLFQISDLFVMPNISVNDDQEGFGIVILEAGCHGLPVIASNIEGIQDAVIEGKTGRLIGEKDVQGFVNAILTPDIDRAIIINEVLANFGWATIGKRYCEEFEKMAAG
jgi:glycosyltransferase involved in cell wall biosynthesis